MILAADAPLASRPAPKVLAGALALGVHLYPIHQLLSTIVPLNLVMQSYMVTRHRDHIAFDLMLRRILPTR